MGYNTVHEPEDDTNPYIALASTAINVVLILAFFVAAVNALGRAGWEQVRYRDAQKEFRRAVRKKPAPGLNSHELVGKNDPPGVQRWVFSGGALFETGTTKIRPQGKLALVRFAEVLRKQRGRWRRVRVEGHTIPPGDGVSDDWELSSARAAVVARVIHEKGHIPSYFLAVAGRAGQDPISKVVVFTQPGQLACVQVTKFLSSRRISFSKKDVQRDPEALQELRDLGFDQSATPVTAADGKIAVGFVPAKLARVTASYPANERVEILVGAPPAGCWTARRPYLMQPRERPSKPPAPKACARPAPNPGRVCSVRGCSRLRSAAAPGGGRPARGAARCSQAGT